MNHPNNEEWMSFVYNEANAAERARLEGHLQECAQCQARVNEWQAARKGLDGWELQPKRRARAGALHVVPLLKWAAVFVLFAGVGFGVGRFSIGAANPEKLRAAIEPEIRKQLRADFEQTMREELDRTASATLAASREETRKLLAAYGETIENARARDNQAISAALDQLGSQQASDYVSLKKQLDTVAVLTDAGLRRTENRVAELADYSEPNQNPNATKHKTN